MSKRSVRTAKDYRGFSRAVTKQGGYIEHGKRHDLVVGDGGKVALPRHTGDYATGTRCSIIKGLLAIGFTLFICLPTALMYSILTR